MSDRELQAAERRWRETGDLEALGQLLRLRRRAGDLAFPRLELAAWLGHPGARAALGPLAPVGPHAPLEAWAPALDPGQLWSGSGRGTRSWPRSCARRSVGSEASP